MLIKSEHLYNYEEIIQFSYNAFAAIGCKHEDAVVASKVLISADIRGVDSHGVARLSGYVRLWSKGRINAKPNIQVVHESPSTATIDADGALGLVS